MKKSSWEETTLTGEAKIFCVKWMPETKPIGIIQIAHGVTEYIERYEEFAEYMTARGFIVCGNDHRGHGKSYSDSQKTPMYLGDKGAWYDVAEDLYNVSLRIKAEHPKLPYIVLGFSMGSFLVRTALINHPQMADAVILAGTGQQNAIAIKLAKFMAKKEEEKYGYAQTTKKIDELTFGTYNRKFAPTKTRFDWLCADEDALAAYLGDPNRGGSMTVGLFSEMIDGMEFVGKPENIKKMNKLIPVLLISGDKDPVGQMGRGVKRTAAAFYKAGVKMIDVVMYKKCRHDIFHDFCRGEVCYDILRWIESTIQC